MYYQRQIFFCTNKTDNGKACCQDHDAVDAWTYVKGEMQGRGLIGPGAVRVTRSGCLGRCAEGPVAVVYPEGVWYSYSSQDDLDEIIDGHLVKGDPVDRLKI